VGKGKVTWEIQRGSLRESGERNYFVFILLRAPLTTPRFFDLSFSLSFLCEDGGTVILNASMEPFKLTYTSIHFFLDYRF